MAIQLITAPTVEPVTLQETKDHLRENSTDEDALISEQIKAARQIAEDYTQRALLTQTWELSIDAFCEQINLPKAPAQSIVSVSYIDTAGVLQTVDASDYELHSQNEPGLLVPALFQTWPTAINRINSVKIRYIAGWQQPQDVPGAIKAAMLLVIGDMFRNREDVSPEQNYILPISARNLLWTHRLLNF